MSILIILLKIIAVILAVLLGFLLLCLFHPVFYQVEGILEENSKPLVKGYFWWLFQILRLEMLFSKGNLSLKLRIFGIGKDLSRGKPEDEPGDESSDERIGESLKESHEDISNSNADNLEGNAEDEQKRASAKEKISEEKGKSLKNKFKKKHKKPKKEKIGKKKFKTGNEEKEEGKFSAIKRELSDEKNKLALSHLWREVLYLLSHLRPKYAKGEINFSTGDPALTGEVTGVLSLCPLFYKHKLHVYPDFASDRFYVQGNLAIKGHMSLYQLVLIVIRLLRDKNFRRLMKKIRK
ncbi:MAG: DUF2953 domain-containing protein [Roseburia sp.]|nr:DUF2953 domain-containing protein [Roseburia sp.]